MTSSTSQINSHSHPNASSSSSMNHRTPFLHQFDNPSTSTSIQSSNNIQNQNHHQVHSHAHTQSYDDHHPLRLDVIDISPISISLRCSRRPLPISAISNRNHPQQSDRNHQQSSSEVEYQGDEDDDDDDTAVDPEEIREDSTSDPQSSNPTSTPLFPFGLTILVNDRNWSRVVVAERGPDEAIIVIFGLADLVNNKDHHHQNNVEIRENGNHLNSEQNGSISNTNGNMTTTSIGGVVSGGKTIAIGTTGIKRNGINCQIILQVRNKSNDGLGASDASGVRRFNGNTMAESRIQEGSPCSSRNPSPPTSPILSDPPFSTSTSQPSLNPDSNSTSTNLNTNHTSLPQLISSNLNAPNISNPPSPTQIPQSTTLKNLLQTQTNLTNQLKQSRRDSSKTENSIKNEIEILKKSLEKNQNLDHRNKQKVLALQESIKQINESIQLIDLEREELERKQEEGKNSTSKDDGDGKENETNLEKLEEIEALKLKNSREEYEILENSWKEREDLLKKKEVERNKKKDSMRLEREKFEKFKLDLIQENERKENEIEKLKEKSREILEHGLTVLQDEIGGDGKEKEKERSNEKHHHKGKNQRKNNNNNNNNNSGGVGGRKISAPINGSGSVINHNHPKFGQFNNQNSVHGLQGSGTGYIDYGSNSNNNPGGFGMGINNHNFGVGSKLNPNKPEFVPNQLNPYINYNNTHTQSRGHSRNNSNNNSPIQRNSNVFGLPNPNNSGFELSSMGGFNGIGGIDQQVDRNDLRSMNHNSRFVGQYQNQGLGFAMNNNNNLASLPPGTYSHFDTSFEDENLNDFLNDNNNIGNHRRASIPSGFHSSSPSFLSSNQNDFSPELNHPLPIGTIGGGTADSLTPTLSNSNLKHLSSPFNNNVAGAVGNLKIKEGNGNNRRKLRNQRSHPQLTSTNNTNRKKGKGNSNLNTSVNGSSLISTSKPSSPTDSSFPPPSSSTTVNQSPNAIEEVCEVKTPTASSASNKKEAPKEKITFASVAATK